MPGLGILRKFFGNSVSNAAGYAVGGAIEQTLDPLLRELANVTWSENTNMPPPAELLAQGVAKGRIDPALAETLAAFTGFSKDNFQLMRQVFAGSPGTAEAYRLWRRELISEAEFRDAVRLEELDTTFIDALVNAKENLLSVADLAVMVQRGIVPNDGLLPVAPPAAAGKVPPMPMIAVDPVDEAGKQGWIKERLAGLARIIGLPASPDLAARMVFRGIIDRVDFDRAISEGNTRNEWAPFLFEGFREIPTARDFVQKHLRGWTNQAGMYAGTARHGYSKADTDTLFEIERRPIPVHQITTGLARGGKFNPQAGELTDPFEASVHQSDLGPEWYELAIANRYTYPSAFVLRTLAQAGELGDTAAVEQVLLEIGWKPSFAAEVAKAWTTAGPTADKNVGKAHTKAWTEAQSSYIARESTAADVQPIFTLLGVTPTAQTEVLKAWDEIRALIRRQLSPSQIHKAVKDGVINPATGVAWTMQDGINALLARGYTQADAQVLLSE